VSPDEAREDAALKQTVADLVAASAELRCAAYEIEDARKLPARARRDRLTEIATQLEIVVRNVRLTESTPGGVARRIEHRLQDAAANREWRGIPALRVVKGGGR
jgi:hypothetical protein